MPRFRSFRADAVWKHFARKQTREKGFIRNRRVAATIPRSMNRQPQKLRLDPGLNFIQIFHGEIGISYQPFCFSLACLSFASLQSE
jgi:hypothetical protein